MTITAIEFCAGIGGQRLALETAGIQVIGAVERDTRKRAIYSRHFGCPEWFPMSLETCATVPRADLWVASADPATLQVVGQLRGPRPRALWLQTAPQPCTIDGDRWVRGGRLHILIGLPVSLAGLADTLPLHRPDECPTAELAELAQGFPEGWTAGYGTDYERRCILGSSLSVTSQIPIARAVVEALSLSCPAASASRSHSAPQPR